MRVQINFDVDERIGTRLAKMAGDRGLTRIGYAKMLFEAAYSARCGVQPDTEIDEQIKIALVLWAAKQDTTTISKAVGLSEPTIIKAIDCWKRERIAA